MEKFITSLEFKDCSCVPFENKDDYFREHKRILEFMRRPQNVDIEYLEIMEKYYTKDTYSKIKHHFIPCIWALKQADRVSCDSYSDACEFCLLTKGYDGSCKFKNIISEYEQYREESAWKKIEQDFSH